MTPRETLTELQALADPQRQAERHAMLDAPLRILTTATAGLAAGVPRWQPVGEAVTWCETALNIGAMATRSLQASAHFQHTLLACRWSQADQGHQTLPPLLSPTAVGLRTEPPDVLATLQLVP